MSILVSVDWLTARLHDSNTVVLDATLPPVGVSPAPDTRARYLAGHIPGAVFFDIDALSDHSTPLPHMLPTPEAFAASMSALGIASDATIVIYEQGNVFSAPRAWWMLRTLGAAHVHLLDGGLTAWTAAGLPTESGEVHRPRAAFRAGLAPGAVTSFAQLQQRLADHAQVLDARSAGRFTGAAPEPRPGLSAGHMPGATSLPFTEVADGAHLKSPDALRAIFQEKGIDLDRPITTTCGSGVTAAVLSLALELAGARHTSLYDGSWAEYAQHPEARIIRDDSNDS